MFFLQRDLWFFIFIIFIFSMFSGRGLFLFPLLTVSRPLLMIHKVGSHTHTHTGNRKFHILIIIFRLKKMTSFQKKYVMIACTKSKCYINFGTRLLTRKSNYWNGLEKPRKKRRRRRLHLLHLPNQLVFNKRIFHLFNNHHKHQF